MSEDAAPLLAVDGGGSKVDAVLLSRSGDVVRAARVSNRAPDGHAPGDPLDVVAAAVERVTAGTAGDQGQAPRLGVFCLAGADLPYDERRMLAWLEERGWTPETILRNDTFAVLRAGTDRGWGVGIVCGFGTNCSARSPDGREYRLPAIGQLSGDWGGGIDIGAAALWYAVRAEDGRGEPTSLMTLVPEYFGLGRPYEVMEAMYIDEIGNDRVAELSPSVFAAAADGDGVARSIVDRQADEIATMAAAAIRSLAMEALDVEVVLGGGILRNGFPAFLDRITEGIARAASRARVVVLTAPPIVGAAMLALDHVDADASAYVRVRERLTHRMLDDTLTSSTGGGS